MTAESFDRPTPALIVRFAAMMFLSLFAVFGLLTLVGVPGTAVKIAAGLGCAIPVNLYGLHVSRRSSRKK
jgi:hypothetical protein